MNADDFEVRTAAEKKCTYVACTASVCYLRHSVPFPAGYLVPVHPSAPCPRLFAVVPPIPPPARNNYGSRVHRARRVIPSPLPVPPFTLGAFRVAAYRGWLVVGAR